MKQKAITGKKIIVKFHSEFINFFQNPSIFVKVLIESRIVKDAYPIIFNNKFQAACSILKELCSTTL